MTTHPAAPMSGLTQKPTPFPPPPPLGISLIVTVFNEGAAIQRLLETIAQQTLRADELVICDGGSTDDTVAVLHAFAQAQGDRLPPVRVLVEPGANISRGRNLAIAAAQGPIIAATDAGVRLDPAWLERLTAPWRTAQAQGDPLPLAVAGFFVPDAAGIFQTAMAATVLPGVTFLAGLHRIGPTHAAMLSTLEPVVTVLLAALLLGELIRPVTLVGGGLILAAVLLLTWRRA